MPDAVESAVVVTLLDTKSGRVAVVSDICQYAWREGNWSCDCNRAGCFDRPSQAAGGFVGTSRSVGTKRILSESTAGRSSRMIRTACPVFLEKSYLVAVSGARLFAWVASFPRGGGVSHGPDDGGAPEGPPAHW